jgi:hypothetical protein
VTLDIIGYKNPSQPKVLLCVDHGEGWAGLIPIEFGQLFGRCTHGAVNDEPCNAPVGIELPHDIQAVVDTLRTVATWVDDDTRDDLYEMAGQVARSGWEDAGSCPVCQETWCDSGCPLKPRRDYELQRATGAILRRVTLSRWEGLHPKSVVYTVLSCPDRKHHDAHVWDRSPKAEYPQELREWAWCDGITPETTWHIGRSWAEARHCEDNCPCPQELCGLVDRAKVLDSCNQHPSRAVKTIRQSHEAKDCPARRPDGETNPTKEPQQ